MPRQTARILLCSVLGFATIFFGVSYFFLSSESAATPGSQTRNKENFLDYKIKQQKLPQAGGEVSLIAVGDISYSRAVARTVRQQNNNIDYPFLKIRDYLTSADVVFGNLETAITPGREIATGEMVFRSNPGIEQALKQAGFSILSLANNHTPNFGAQGLKDTLTYLEQAGIKYMGAGLNQERANQPVFMEIKGVKFAWLAYNDPSVVPASYEAGANRAGTAFMRTQLMTKTVKEIKTKVDFVIVSMHAGAEYVNQPSASQKKFARAAIDAGAALVIGHHPHVVQTLEKYQGKYIFYSLGNFVFDQMWSQATREGLAAKIYFTKHGVSKISLLPVIIENFSQPRPANASEAIKILTRLNFALNKEVRQEKFSF